MTIFPGLRPGRYLSPEMALSLRGRFARSHVNAELEGYNDQLLSVKQDATGEHRRFKRGAASIGALFRGFRHVA